MQYTRVDFLSAVEDYDGIPGVQITLWSCDECGALVRDQSRHSKWHAK